MAAVNYELGYVVFGALFLIGLIGYWIIASSFKEPLDGGEQQKGAKQ